MANMRAAVGPHFGFSVEKPCRSLGNLATQCEETFPMLRIGHVPLGIKILVDVWDAHLLRKHQDPDAAEDGTYVD